MLEIKTLGCLSFKANGQIVKNLGSHKAEAIMVYLAKEGREVNRNILKTLLWPESSEELSSTSLRVELSNLKKILGTYLDISRDLVGIKPDGKVNFDLHDLEGSLACGQVEQALKVYQGSFLQGFHIRDSPEFEDWLRWEQERVDRSVISALHTSISKAIKAEEFSRGLDFVWRLLEIDPMDELAHQKCMLLLALGGQRSSALTQFEKCSAILKNELGVEPSKETNELYGKIIRGEYLSQPVPAIPKHNLPTKQTSFIGREKELAEIERLIHDPLCRLITLVGPGGIGKTRLALQAANNTLRLFPDGAYFVSLDTCNLADHIVPAIASALQFDIDTMASDLDPKSQLIDYLRNRVILLLVDGFEQLIDHAKLFSEILEQAPQVQVLATSRQKLALKSEWIFHVEGLPFPESLTEAPKDDTDALRLFIERSYQANSSFGLQETDYEDAVRICQLVEGMPLGIELAAAWTSVLSPWEISEEIEKSLDFLTTSLRDVPEKHRSLQAVFESSWQLLTEEQRELFSTLSVFRGGFDRKAAMLVAGATLPQLSTLLDKSLLRRSETGYFTMHGLLQQYGAEKLKMNPDQKEDLYERHCAYFVDFLTQREADFMGGRMIQARKEIWQEIENIRAAVYWAIFYWGLQQVRKLFMSLMSFYNVQGWYEAINAFHDIVQKRSEFLEDRGYKNLSKDPIIVCAKTHMAFFLSDCGQIVESETISRECLEILKKLKFKEELSECLQNLGVNASLCGEYETAEEYLEKAILLGRDCDHIFWPSYLLWLGHNYFLQGEYEKGKLSLEKCYELFDQKGTLWGTAYAISKLGLAADGLGEHSQALKYNQQALSIFEKSGIRIGIAYSLSRMSISAFFLEDYSKAVEFAQEGYRIFEELGHRWGKYASMCRLGFSYLGSNDIGKAKENFRNALKLSWEDQIIPLCLYALVGLASTMVEEGDEEKALELFLFAEKHPQIPLPYLEQAAHWMGEFDLEAQRDVRPGESEENKMEAMEKIFARALE